MLPALHAHRLGRAYGPDSSLAALHGALQQPLDGLETDCCLTADGELVLLHDPLLDLGTTVSGWAHQRTAAEIRAGRLRNHDGTVSDERPLLLDELLDLAPPGATLQLEVKAHADPVLACRTARAVCERRRRPIGLAGPSLGGEGSGILTRAGMDDISLQQLLEVVGDFDESGGASVGLIAWELFVEEQRVARAWERGVAEGLLRRAGRDRVADERLWRLSAGGWAARNGAGQRS